MAATLHNEWAGTMVIYVGDNLNVQRWVETRQAHNVFARYLLRVLGAIEAVFHFEVISPYLRTYHNVTADAITRESKMNVELLRPKTQPHHALSEGKMG
eukprot:641304-Heterocapsa_arctica.AAC.1